MLCAYIIQYNMDKVAVMLCESNSAKAGRTSQCFENHSTSMPEFLNFFLIKLPFILSFSMLKYIFIYDLDQA